MSKDNITLIGMPGVGKSTVGVVLAKVLGYRFLDSDLEIQEQTGKLLHELIEEYGGDGFLEIENRVNAGLEVSRSVIATGGSAVFGKEAMEHLRDISTVVYLRLPCEQLQDRLGDLHQRGVVLKPGQTLQDLMQMRAPFYEKYAHIIVDEEDLDIRGIVKKITTALKNSELAIRRRPGPVAGKRTPSSRDAIARRGRVFSYAPRLPPLRQAPSG